MEDNSRAECSGTPQLITVQVLRIHHPSRINHGQRQNCSWHDLKTGYIRNLESLKIKRNAPIGR
jgi:hypothetical protein